MLVLSDGRSTFLYKSMGHRVGYHVTEITRWPFNLTKKLKNNRKQHCRLCFSRTSVVTSTKRQALGRPVVFVHVAAAAQSAKAMSGCNINWRVWWQINTLLGCSQTKIHLLKYIPGAPPVSFKHRCFPHLCPFLLSPSSCCLLSWISCQILEVLSDLSCFFYCSLV